MMKSPSIPVSIAVGLLIAACGGEQPRPAETGVDATVPVSEEHFSPVETAADRGSGTLRLGDTTYQFAVRACDFDGDTDDIYQTLSGRGTTDTGETFDVFASRNDAGGMLSHTVSFQTGDVRSGAGTVLEAQRIQHGATWISVRGGPAEPLIRIDGDRLTASGRFGSDDDAGAPVDGHLEATCR